MKTYTLIDEPFELTISRVGGTESSNILVTMKKDAEDLGSTMVVDKYELLDAIGSFSIE
jgi:hypothetical protein